MKYAVMLFNKDESGVIGVVESTSKLKAVKAARQEYGDKYKVGKAYPTQWDLGIHYLYRSPASLLNSHYSFEEQDRLIAEIEFLKQQQADRKQQEWEANNPDGAPPNPAAGLKKELPWLPIEPRSKYDRVHFDENGRQITRKEWKRRQKKI